ncbi:hypothetical protein [Chitinophaga agri]|uniref:Uncharacterized protein n=1 Tax=Chitinophaga agri TaxID=2703787 RepID=A0A6B9ZI64_9BACT|nr:hypothetical protein [Chitinophaga agri]QHS60835.1 hypothetical protein GWR21_14890 [Chitinophaga agri]
MTEQLKQALSAKGYRVFSRPYELNIVGIRAATNVPNAFDDTIFVFYSDGTQWKLLNYPITTDPGMHYLKQPINNAGTAILKAGQYFNCYATGLHRGLYTALVQQAPVTVIRDFNKNGLLDFGSGKEQTGMFGINIHRAEITGTTKYVSGHSAGCQVFANATDFAAFMQLCAQHKKLYGNKFTYTLLEQAELPAVLTSHLPSPPLGEAA